LPYRWICPTDFHAQICEKARANAQQPKAEGAWVADKIRSPNLYSRPSYAQFLHSRPFYGGFGCMSFQIMRVKPSLERPSYAVFVAIECRE
jgi:hypothetical protein